MKKRLLFWGTLICLCACFKGFAQSPFDSESIIKYNMKNHTTDKPIPFHKPFTLEIDSLPSKDLKTVHVYETESRHGVRLKVENTYIDCDDKKAKNAIKDIVLKTNPYSKTVQIFFPALKPNVDFDINLIYNLSADCRELLMAVNEKLATDMTKGGEEFKSFKDCTIDKMTSATYTSIRFDDYKSFYTSKLAVHYSNVASYSSYQDTGVLTLRQLQGIDMAGRKPLPDFEDSGNLVEVINNSLFKDILLGRIDITKVYAKDRSATTDHNVQKRAEYLESNLKYFDNLLQRTNRIIAKGKTSITVNGTAEDLTVAGTAVSTIKSQLQHNLKYIKGELKEINKAIDEDERIKLGRYVAGNTISSDLKTRGGNVLFVDMGLASIFAKDIHDDWVTIPKLYMGVSIYFKPIDKNTRRGKLPCSLNPPLNKGCRDCKPECKEADCGNAECKTKEYGPDYGIVATRSVWNNLCLNVGITLGAMTNKGFDNLYNSNSLLIGPGYRFARAFKFSMGAALMKRESKNPLISEKCIIAGTYASLSVDVDFLQAIKEVTSIVYK